jgi:hypothetical protein
LRSFVRFGSAMSVFGMARLGSALSCLDLCTSAQRFPSARSHGSAVALALMACRGWGTR